MKAILVIADGMADVPLKDLKGKTPLEAAEVPNLDEIAKRGICGLVDVIGPGIPPGSDTAHLALLGYDVIESYTGRGALEAIGSGVDILPNDLAFRCNFATVDSDFIVLDRRAGRITSEEAAALTETIQESIKMNPPEVGDILFTSTVQHRAILRLSGPKLSALVSDTDPHRTGRKVLQAHPLDEEPEAEHTANVLNTLTLQLHDALTDHPVNRKRVRTGLPVANAVLFRGVGTLPELDPLSLLYGIHPAAIAAVPLVKGVCKAAGMRLINAKDANGTYETDTEAKAKAAIASLKRFDFVLVHVKATDLASHDRNPQKKIEMIKKVDALVAYILRNIDSEEVFLAVTADHTTSSVKGEHSGEPVPLAISGPNVRQDDVGEFGERTCGRGGLNRIRGVDLMPILMNLLGKAEKAGS
jgi:2,3-bisphosphoglycerate-independent phosphoglycerate mutase